MSNSKLIPSFVENLHQIGQHIGLTSEQLNLIIPDIKLNFCHYYENIKTNFGATSLIKFDYNPNDIGDGHIIDIQQSALFLLLGCVAFGFQDDLNKIAKIAVTGTLEEKTKISHDNISIELPENSEYEFIDEDNELYEFIATKARASEEGLKNNTHKFSPYWDMNGHPLAIPISGAKLDNGYTSVGLNNSSYYMGFIQEYSNGPIGRVGKTGGCGTTGMPSGGGHWGYAGHTGPVGPTGFLGPIGPTGIPGPVGWVISPTDGTIEGENNSFNGSTLSQETYNFKVPENINNIQVVTTGAGGGGAGGETRRSELSYNIIAGDQNNLANGTYSFISESTGEYPDQEPDQEPKQELNQESDQETKPKSLITSLYDFFFDSPKS